MSVKAKVKPIAEVVKPKEAKPELLKVLAQPEKPFRKNSARDVYWSRFCKWDGKELQELEKSCSDDPPSVPKKGHYEAKQEPFGGWVSFFKQKNLISVK